MKKLLILATAILAITLTSCSGDAISSETKGDFKVEFLFEKDGIKVYRFRDGSRSHYFTNKGETTTTQNSGKSTYEETIN
jgi:hypothetical protein